jgi:hypothetical protein
MTICKSSFVAVILSLSVSGSAFANSSAPISSYDNGIAHIFHLNTLSGATVAGSIKNTTTSGDIPFFKGKDHFERKFPEATKVECKKKGQFLKKEYPSYLVTEASEFSDADDGLSYYVAVTGPGASYLLHVSTSGTISVFKKMKQ